jgi:hypothetical protein
MKEIKNPESIGLILNLMARYAEGKSEHEFDKAVGAALGSEPAVKQSVKQMIERLRKNQEVMSLLPKDTIDNPGRRISGEIYKAAFHNLKALSNGNGSNTMPRIEDEDLTARNGKVKLKVTPDIRIFYRGLLCLNETSESSASDEPYLITSVVDSNLKVKTVCHPFGEETYTDVDAGEKRVGPEVVIYNGKAQDLTLIAIMMENDYGDPNHFRGEIDAGIKAAAAAIAAGTGVAIPGAILGVLADIVNVLFGTEDDVIEKTTRSFDKEQLVAWLKEPLKTKEKITLGGKEFDLPAAINYHFRTSHRGDGGAYRAYYRIKA